MSGAEKLGGVSHYYIGNNRAKWTTNVPAYARAECRHVYPGIDLVYHTRCGVLEYDFVLSPGADPGKYKETNMETKTVLSGYAIVVASSGWVYVGNVEVSSEWCTITNAKNIRRWGTTAGLGEIAKNGPNEGTKLDDYGNVRLPISSIIGGIIDADESKWK